MIRISKDTTLSTEMLRKIIENHKTADAPRFTTLEQYYQGKHKILERRMADPTKPNNQVINPYANYITDSFVGYFMGEPISYNSKQEEALAALQLTLVYNDEQDENSELAKDASIYGVAFEMLYVDEDGVTRFKKVCPKEVVPIFDNTVEGEMLYAVRYYDERNILDTESHVVVEVYSRSEVKIYKANDKLNDWGLIEERPHYFGLVPFTMFKNNDDMLGDFELVISLIDAYDKLASDSLNDFEYFTDAYLALYGMDADAEDIKMMKENRVMLLPEDGKAEWIIKNVNDAQIENLKTRLEQDIHKFSKCPSMTDKDFAANASGVSMRYKLMGMENITSIKERKFKKGLQRRIELLSNIMSLNSITFDWRAIEITFKRNIPVNVVEIADTINKLRGIVSNGTLISQLPFVEDVQQEMEKVEQERSSSSFDMFSALRGGTDDGEVLATEAGADSK